MSNWRRVPQKRATVRIRTPGPLVLMGAAIMVRGQTAISPAAQAKYKTSNPSANSAEPAGKKAWNILREGLEDTNPDKRAKAARALGLPGNTEAQKAAVLALKDEKSNVRLAAAHALGSMGADNAKGNLEEALGDSEPSVVLAAANSLLLLHDDVGYDTYYEVLTGEKRAGSRQRTDQRAIGHTKRQEKGRPDGI